MMYSAIARGAFARYREGMSISVPVLIRYVLALVAGLLLSLAYAPTNWGMLAWFFPAALFALLQSMSLVEGRRARLVNFGRGFLLAFVAGFGFWVRDVAFIGAVSQQGGWVSSGAMALYLALFFGLYGGWAVAFGRPPAMKPRVQPALMILKYAALHGLAWCSIEWLRGLGRLSFGWDSLGVSFMDSGFVIAQVADLVGVNGLSFIPVFGGVVLVMTIRAFHLEATHGYRRVHFEVFVAMLMVVLAFTYGSFRLKGLHTVETEPIRSLVIQQNVPVADSLDPAREYDIYSGYTSGLERAMEGIIDRAALQLEQTGEATLESPDLVVFPESALPIPIWRLSDGGLLPDQGYELFVNNDIRSQGDFLFISGVLEFPCHMVDGVPLHYAEGNIYNAMGFFSSDFKSYEHRPKNHLMPFGEYMPLSNLPLVQLAYEYSAGMVYGGDFTAASQFEPYQAEIRGHAYSIIPSVCYEDTVSSLTRKYLRPEPQLIVNVTNDGWFAGTVCAEKHYQNARYRAIEYRRPLVRAANTGVSAVVNLTGASVHPETLAPQELRNEAGECEIKGALEAVVSLPTQPIPTLYAVIGNVPCWGGGLVVLIWTVLGALKGKWFFLTREGE